MWRRSYVHMLYLCYENVTMYEKVRPATIRKPSFFSRNIYRDRQKHLIWPVSRAVRSSAAGFV